MSVPSDPRLARAQVAFIQAEVRHALQLFTNNLGQIDFTKGNGFSGTLAYPNGGTNNQLGQAVPKDGSVTDVKVAAGADIDPAKLNQALLAELVQDLVAALIVAGTGISATYDDPAGTLTLSATAAAPSLATLSDVVLTDLQNGDDLVYLTVDNKWHNRHTPTIVTWSGAPVLWNGGDILVGV